MNTEQERAEFEAWFTKIEAYTGNPKDIFMQIAREIAWDAWQARAALQSQDREDAARHHHPRPAGGKGHVTGGAETHCTDTN